MATGFSGVKGTYDQKVKDSNTQDPKKFTKSINQPTDNRKKPSSKINPPKDSGA